MAKFIVSIPIAGSATFEVEASDAKTAKEAAWEAVNGHCEPEVEWEYLESVSSDIAARQQRLADIGGYSDAISAEHDVAGPAYHEKHVALFAAIRALRAHREKVGR